MHQNGAHPIFQNEAGEGKTPVLSCIFIGQLSSIMFRDSTSFRKKFGLVLYCCIRSTDTLEGGVHHNTIRKFGSFGANPEISDAMLLGKQIWKKIKGHYDRFLACPAYKPSKYRAWIDPWPANNKHLAADIDATTKFGGVLKKKFLVFAHYPIRNGIRLSIQKLVTVEHHNEDI
ncbi:hypothetical protein BD770DRAFT_425585 [Pilaira anomala]|nr:hypothetical protein BD770DRAFT_425585 [Pilaira anomala]